MHTKLSDLTPVATQGSTWGTPQTGWLEGFFASWSMILVSEIGDKTFFIACLLAMRHPRIVVFTGAIAALAAMTVLSALMGVLVPSLLSVRVTEALAVILFTGFGIKILYEALNEGPQEEAENEEMAEAAAAIGKKSDDDSSVGLSRGATRWSKVINPVMVQAFTLTFVAEWGDRSQIATIALAAAKNPYAVTVGGILGHAICTGGAVMFGNLIASRVSSRSVNICGGALFIFFGLATLYELIVTPDHHAALTGAPNSKSA
jgi:putative Ca2+/H+ antiporter (TMEM165/GDT1 family)